MTETKLIGMAEIARLAGESRATVGNWKRRYPDFPQERGRNPRGPLYDQAEIQAWLLERKPQPERSKNVIALRLANILRSAGLRHDLPFGLAILAVRAAGGRDWDTLLRSHPGEALEALFNALLKAVPGLTEREFEVFSSALGVVEGDTILELAHAVAAAPPDTDLEAEASFLVDSFTQLSPAVADFATPKDLIDLMLGLTDPHGAVYDPCVGTGRLLAEAARTALSKQDAVHAASQDISPTQTLIARLYFTISKVDVALAVGDIFLHDAFPTLAADCVVADPPLGMRLRPDQVSRDDPRWLYGDPSPADPSGAWLQHILAHLAPGGRAVMVVPNSVLRGDSRDRILQRIIRADLLDAVISLPSGMHIGTKVPIALLVLRRERPNGARQGMPGPVLMVDCQPSAVSRASVTVDVPALLRHYTDWTNTASTISGPTTPSAIVAYSTLANNEFALDPRRYTKAPVTNPASTRSRKELESALSKALDDLRCIDAHKLFARRNEPEGPVNLTPLGEIGALEVMRGVARAAVGKSGVLPIYSIRALRERGTPIGCRSSDRWYTVDDWRIRRTS